MLRSEAKLAAASVLLSAAAGLGALELVCRLKEPALPAGQRLAAPGFFAADAALDYDIRPGFPARLQPAFELVPPYELWSNELGCQDKPYDRALHPRPVLLVGDSFTQGNLFEKSWGSGLERRLKRRVLKCGVVGFGTAQELGKARKLVAAGIKPSLIVVGYFMNDLGDDHLFPGRTVMTAGRVTAAKRVVDLETGRIAVKTPGELERMARIHERTGEITEAPSEALYVRSALYRRVFRKLSARRSARAARDGLYLAFLPSKPWLEEAWKRHLANLDGFAGLARETGAGLLVVLIPKKEQVFPALAPQAFDLPLGADLEAPNRRLTAYLKERKIAYLDLLPAFREANDRELYWKADLHWSWKGEALAAELVARRLARGLESSKNGRLELDPGP